MGLRRGYSIIVGLTGLPIGYTYLSIDIYTYKHILGIYMTLKQFTFNFDHYNNIIGAIIYLKLIATAV